MNTNPPVPSTMTDDDAALTSTSIPTESSSRDYSQTQRSLEHAAAMIEAAYRRIRQVRRNLLHIMDSVPNPVTTQHSQENNGIGPGHEAIALTEGSGERAINLDVRSDILSVNMIEEQLRHIETRIESGLRAARDHHHLDSNSPRATISTYANPSILDRPIVVPRDSHSESPLPRPQELDEATTSIGRRVIAREAAGSNSVATSGVSPRLDDSAFFASLEREIENFRSAARIQRPRVPSSTPVDNPRFPALRRGAYVPSLSTGVGVSSASEHRRRRVYGTSSAHSPSLERLSLLSNLSVQNLPTPVSPAAPRPLIFDEPISYIPAANFTQVFPNTTDEPVVGDNEERSYIIRRRYNADGDEHVHPINLDWIDEEHPPWLLPRGIPRDDLAYEHWSLGADGAATRGQPQDRPVSNRSEARQRRRGWARLDPDGNEIPSDEEEEIERIRTEHRLRAQSRPRVPASVPSRNVEARSSPTTMPPDGENNLHPESIPRVRLSGPIFGSVADHTSPAESARKVVSRPAVESPAISCFQVDPLPMPLKEMVYSQSKPEAPPAAWIPRHANFAGR